MLVLLKYWPKVDPIKEVSCLTELETIFDNLKNIGPLIEIRTFIITQVVHCAKSLHFSVAERALLLMHNPVILALLAYDKQNLL